MNEIEYLADGTIHSIKSVNGYVIETEQQQISTLDDGEIVCGLCWVDANIIFVDDGSVWKKIRGYSIYTGNHFEIDVPNSEFVNDNKHSLIKKLSDVGLEIAYGQNKKVMTYLAQQRAAQTIFAVKQIGWHQSNNGRWVYVRPDRIIGESTPPLTLLTKEVSPVHDAIRRSCTLEVEQQHVTNYCSGNDLLIFATGIAFASLMMRHLGIEGGGFHFYGHSSRGKTTLLQMIAVILGNASDPGRNSQGCFIQSWDATNFGIELTAKSCNDIACLFDELHKYSDTKLDSLIYTIAGGLGKSRGSGDLTLRRSNTWLNMVGSTGEHSIPAAIAKISPNKVTTGQQIRILDILVEDNVFPNTHGMEARQFVEMLKENCAQYYGASGEQFTENLIPIVNDAESKSALIQRHKELAINLEKEGMSVEQARVLPRFAAVQLGLQLAIDMQLINITLDEANSAVVKALTGWLNNVDTLSDIERGIENIRTFIRTQPRRFRDANNINDRVTNIVGYRDNAKHLYLIIPSQFELVCGKSHTREILKALMEKDLLFTNNTNGKGNYKPSSRHRIAGEIKKPTLYAIKAKILDDGEESETDLADETDPLFGGVFEV